MYTCKGWASLHIAGSITRIFSEFVNTIKFALSPISQILNSEQLILPFSIQFDNVDLD